MAQQEERLIDLLEEQEYLLYRAKGISDLIGLASDEVATETFNQAGFALYEYMEKLQALNIKIRASG